ncbi:transcription factor IIA subunit alpha [Linnemannia exigua]|uniref:Transcription initiation factor IIA large subunit n=1 Tax=Linnemannia exigua TaxID=604196 RepID=A0AAD4H6D8_9FUNG|nr:transcription factor IIA subunit alpha [Linnemannia exigua]
MANSTVTAVYRFVIDDVITNVRRDFEDMGVDETIMHELQRSWEAKLAQAKVAAMQPAEPAAAVESYPFEEPAYEQPATTSAQSSSSAPAPAPPAAISAPASSGSAHAPTLPPLPSLPLPPVPVAPPASVPYNYRVEQTPAANLANVASTTQQGEHGNAGRPQQYAPSRKNISTPGGGRNNTNNIPQHDGPADAGELEMMSRQELDAFIEKKIQEGEGLGEMTFTLTMSDRAARKMKRDGLGLGADGFTIGQVDGDDDDNNGTEDDTGLGSDLDDSDGDMDEESDNIVLCQYDKVSRTKSKWKCVLKDGIMLINGRDYLFHKANGDFEW